MENSEYTNILNCEEHFYYLALHKLLLLLTSSFGSKEKRLDILDAGCGVGTLAKKLAGLGSITAIDSNPLACHLAKKNGLNALVASVTELPFEDARFDLVYSIDVIYHKNIREDSQAISEMVRVLKPHGLLIIKVPAISWLHSPHDQHVHTRERYDASSFRRKLESAGLKIRLFSFTSMSLLIPALMRHFSQKIMPRKPPRSALRPLPKLINRMAYQVLSFENKWVKKGRIPIGIGLIAVAEKH